MIGVRILIDEEAVDAYLQENGLEQGFEPLEAVLLQVAGTAEGKPCAMLVAEVDGNKVLIKTSLRALMAATSALNTRAEMLLGRAEMLLGPGWRGP